MQEFLDVLSHTSSDLSWVKQKNNFYNPYLLQPALNRDIILIKVSDFFSIKLFAL